MTSTTDLTFVAGARALTPAVAAGWVWSWLRPFAEAPAGLYAQPFDSERYERLEQHTLERLIVRSAMGRLPGDPWSHRFLLRLEPGSGLPAGACRLRVGDAQGDEPGVELCLRCDAPAAELHGAFFDALRDGTADFAHMGPVETTGGEVCKVVVFTKDARLGKVPAGAQARPVGGGVCILACPLSAPEHEMRAAAGALGRALEATTSEATQAPSQTPPRQAPAEVPRPPHVAAAPAVATPPELDPYETTLIPAIFIASPAVPFAGTTSPDKVAEMFDPVEPRKRPPEPGPDETALVPVQAFVMPKTGTFRDQLGPLVVPVISLDEYAELRARLTVYGESHEPTLKRFGVAAREVHEAVRGRFSEYFLRDPSAQAQFLKAMQAAIGRVRAERDGSEK